MKTLAPIEIATSPEVDSSVIWLHGLGADGHDFAPIVPELRLPESPAIRFIFPHAPEQPVTLNAGYIMRSWYDIDAQLNANKADIQRSSEHLKSLIEKEIARGVSSERIVVAGFSQGGVIALHTALRFAKPLAGVMALSTYLPTADDLEQEADAANRDIPVFMAHGTQDDIVTPDRAIRARRALTELSYTVEWHDYPMAHSVCPEEIAAIGQWLQRVLPAAGPDV